jgi:hypothetical protein
MSAKKEVGKFASRANISSSFETDWISSSSTGGSPHPDLSGKVNDKGFTRYGTGNSEVVQRRQGFWLHQQTER